MDAHKENLNAFFLQTKGISEGKIKFYVGWLSRFPEFYRGSLDEVSEGDLNVFGEKGLRITFAAVNKAISVAIQMSFL
jgi:hypothetical protein